MLDIEKQFPGVKALDHARLQLRPGSIHALMGENGAGKSTLMKCLFGIYKKDAGSIRMNGKEINFTSPRNALDHGVAMVHQELNQVLYRSVMENMWLGRVPLKAGLVDHKKMYNDTKALLDKLGVKLEREDILATSGGGEAPKKLHGTTLIYPHARCAGISCHPVTGMGRPAPRGLLQSGVPSLLTGGLHCPPSLKVGLKRLTLSWLLSI